MSNKDNFLKLVSNESAHTSDKIKWRNHNSHWLERSRNIALKILQALDEKDMHQKDLANLLDVSPQQVING